MSDAIGKALEVYASKTSEEGKSLQATAPNSLVFSNDENSIWFNGKKYGVYKFKNIIGLKTGDSSTKIATAIGCDEGDFTNVINAIKNNNIFINVLDSDNVSQHFIISSVSVLVNSLIIIINSNSNAQLFTIIPNDNKFTITVTTYTYLTSDEIEDNLTSTAKDKALSANQGNILSKAIEELNRYPGAYICPGTIDYDGTDLQYADDSDVIPVFGSYSTFIENVITKNRPIIAKINYNNRTSYAILNASYDATNQRIRLFGFIESSTFAVILLNYDSSAWAGGTGGIYTILNTSNVVNNLTSTSTTNALSAAQGKALNDKITALGNVYRVKGTKTNITDVLALTDAKVGDVWNVTNAFTLNSLKYSANTNVVCVTATSSSDHNDDNWDALGGIISIDDKIYNIIFNNFDFGETENSYIQSQLTSMIRSTLSQDFEDAVQNCVLFRALINTTDNKKFVVPCSINKSNSNSYNLIGTIYYSDIMFFIITITMSDNNIDSISYKIINYGQIIN